MVIFIVSALRHILSLFPIFWVMMKNILLLNHATQMDDDVYATSMYSILLAEKQQTKASFLVPKVKKDTLYTCKSTYVIEQVLKIKIEIIMSAQ